MTTNEPTGGSPPPTSTKRTPERSSRGGSATVRHPSVQALSEARADLLRIFAAAVAAADPQRLVERQLATMVAARPTLVVGAGKAAARMAAGCEAALGAEQLSGLVVVADGCEVPLRSVRVATAGHPVPDQRGLDATAALCRLLETRPDVPLLCVISGGASSLLVMPRPPLTLADKAMVNRLLLASGADIDEVNTVRKHLSLVKGGGLLRMAGRRALRTLALSDVVGDQPSTIGSGPTVPDPTTFADAEAVLHRHGIHARVPASVRDVLVRGRRGEIPETPKPTDRASADAEYVVIGSNRTALSGAAAEAERLGYVASVATAPLAGDTTAAARAWVESLAGAGTPPTRACYLAGGETTVEVHGAGRGGRNQEFALAVVDRLDGSNLVVLSAGTDGIDGPTDAAGAIVDPASRSRAERLGLDPARALTANDSYRFFDQLGDLIRCGPTGTNVMDIKVAVYLPPPT